MKWYLISETRGLSVRPKVDRLKVEKYLLLTDWVESLYTREVVREKTMTNEEYLIKYVDILTKREEGISVL